MVIDKVGWVSKCVVTGVEKPPVGWVWGGVKLQIL